MNGDQWLAIAIVIAFVMFLIILIIMSLIKMASAVEETNKAIKQMILFSNQDKKPAKPKIEEEVIKKDSVKRRTVCPNCGDYLFSWQNCCSKCGQIIDWEGEKI